MLSTLFLRCANFSLTHKSFPSSLCSLSYILTHLQARVPPGFLGVTVALPSNQYECGRLVIQITEATTRYSKPQLMV